MIFWRMNGRMASLWKMGQTPFLLFRWKSGNLVLGSLIIPVVWPEWRVKRFRRRDFYSCMWQTVRRFFLGTLPVPLVRKISGFAKIPPGMSEPELTLFATSNGNIIGLYHWERCVFPEYRGESTVFLRPNHDGCACLGPCLYVPKEPLEKNTRSV